MARLVLLQSGCEALRSIGVALVRLLGGVFEELDEHVRVALVPGLGPGLPGREACPGGDVLEEGEVLDHVPPGKDRGGDSPSVLVDAVNEGVGGVEAVPTIQCGQDRGCCGAVDQ